MNLMMNALTRPDGTNGWEIPKIHGAILMRNSIVEDGPGEGTTTMHGEDMHKTVAKGHTKRTQKRGDTLTAQMSVRHHEHVTLDASAKAMRNNLLIHNSVSEKNVGSSQDNRSYWRNDFKVDDSCFGEGMFTMTIPSESDLKDNKGFAHVAWSSHKKHKKGCLLYTSPSPRDISGSRMPSSA